MTSFLTKILDKKKEEIAFLYSKTFFDASISNPLPHVFLNALQQTGLSLIAELKKASPSKGIINPTFNPLRLAKQYVKQGASALSILTERHFFLGDPIYISQVKKEISIPILRKDFIIDPIQITESVHLGADAVLLIQACLNPEKTQQLITMAIEKNLDVLLEVHDKAELELALSYKGLSLIGINNRNLNTFDIDIETAIRLKQSLSNDSTYLLVAESGYTTIDALRQLETEGFRAVLIGTGLVKYPDILSFWDS
jgi:indole-3-glycerol phosphate synthase